MTADIKYDKDWLRLKNGDLTALESIYSAYVNAMISYGSRITCDEHLIKDAIQDLFIELWKSRENLANIAQPKYYLFRALRNKLIRNTSQQTVTGDDELADNQPATYIHLEIAEQEAIQRNNLHQLLQQLPRRQQEVIYLRFYQDCSYETIADMMDMNYQSVLNLTQRALKSLRKGFPVNSPGSHY
jgi:RNA polymerase sigma factor (sigma-70 family)